MFKVEIFIFFFLKSLLPSPLSGFIDDAAVATVVATVVVVVVDLVVVAAGPSSSICWIRQLSMSQHVQHEHTKSMSSQSAPNFFKKSVGKTVF